MDNKVTIKTERIKKIVCVVEYVFKANFNDTYYLDEIVMDLESIKEDGELFYFDPYMGKSKISDTMVAISYVDDNEYTILVKKNGVISKESNTCFLGFTISEPFDDSMFLAAHIHFRT